jgi:hypothetical protein
MPELLSKKEAARFYRWSIWAKPFMTYSLTMAIISICATACYLLIIRQATMDHVSTLLITIVSTVAPVLGAIVLGKSYERGKGVKDEEIVPSVLTEESRAPDSSGSSIADLGAMLDPDVLMSRDPMVLLNKLDLDEFMPKIADDKPVV